MITTRSEVVDGRTILVVEHPDGGCTTIADIGDDLHAILTLNGQQRRDMRYSFANRAGAKKRRPRHERAT